jgi:hypothetical protein
MRGMGVYIPPFVLKEESGNDMKRKRIGGVFRRKTTALQRRSNGATTEESGPLTPLGTGE